MNRITRAERLLTKIADRGGISPCGKDWLIAAIDPMHDTQLKDLQGWPDVESAPSVVRCIKKSMTLKAPTGITGNWDCHVFAVPWQNAMPFTGPNSRFGNLIQTWTAADPNLALGGVQAYGTNSGTALSFVTSPYVGGLDLDATYAQGSSRLIGMGLEVVNTTSDLNRQGQVTVWRQPEANTPTQSFVAHPYGVDPNPSRFSVKQCRGPPLDQSTAMLLSGSRQWKAADGSYQAATFMGEENPPMYAEYVMPMLDADPTSEDLPTWDLAGIPTITSNDNMGSVYLPTPVIASYLPLPEDDLDKGKRRSTGAPAVPVNLAVAQATKIYPIHEFGAIYTGLSNSTTLTVTVNWYVESFPGPAERGLIVLATPSAEFDPIALELFSRCMGELPVGVPAGMNLMGDWFASVVETASDVLAPIATALGFPMIGAPIAAAGKLASTFKTPQTPQTKPLPPPLCHPVAPPQFQLAILDSIVLSCALLIGRLLILASVRGGEDAEINLSNFG